MSGLWREIGVRVPCAALSTMVARLCEAEGLSP